MSDASKEFAKEQYTKIQDYVIYNRKYKNKPDSMSHADIVLSEIQSLTSEVSSLQAERDKLRELFEELKKEMENDKASGYLVTPEMIIRFVNKALDEKE